MNKVLNDKFNRIKTKLYARCSCIGSSLAAAPRLRWEVSFLLGLVVTIVLTTNCSSFAAAAAQVRADTLRLHVQAASDSPADQLLKLKVRDAVLQQAQQLFQDCPNQAAAKKAALAGLPKMQLAAEQVVAQQGAACSVRVKITRMSFPTTHYKTFSLPAGPYDALRVELGAAKGHNWFCVLYPALCLPAAQSNSPAAWPTAQEQQLVSGGYTIRFALLELLQKLGSNG